MLGGPYRWGRRGDNHGHFQPNDLRCEIRKPLKSAVSISSLSHGILPIDVAKVTQTVAEGLEVRRIGRRRERRKIANPSDVRLLLRLDGGRRGDGAKREATKERAPVHHSMI